MSNETTDPEDMSWARLLLSDEIEAKDADIARLPSVASLKSWRVGVTEDGTPEVRMTLGDKQEARAWAVWLANKETE